MLKKATFFVLETSHINEIRVTILAGNSYPYYQDKKKLVTLVSKIHKYTNTRAYEIHKHV